MISDPGPASLTELEARLRRDFELLVLPPAKDWLEPRTHPEHGAVLDVAVIGAGMSGLAAAFALKCLAIRALRVFDRSPEGFEGPWATYARMETLRSPPELSGPAFGVSNLTFRAWFEAQFGLAAWKNVHRIPRLQWMDYLRWYRRVIDVPICPATATSSS
jgi:cation diffusion facilitator CzcD-associated flavoprotein CzcO